MNHLLPISVDDPIEEDRYVRDKYFYKLGRQGLYAMCAPYKENLRDHQCWLMGWNVYECLECPF